MDDLCSRGVPVHNADVVALIARKGRLDFPAGDRYVYSNTGYALLAVLVERASGLSFPEFLQRNIFGPLGLKESFVNVWGVPPLANVARSYTESSQQSADTPDAVNCGTVYGDGAVFSSAHDMGLWNLALQSNRVIGTPTPMDEAYSPGLTNNGRFFPYGFAWRLETFHGLKEYMHTGHWAGFHNLNARFPDENFAVVVLANQPRLDEADVVSKALATYLGK
jgi:CubicO group peptidase (beta-lactamase class C family)